MATARAPNATAAAWQLTPLNQLIILKLPMPSDVHLYKDRPALAAVNEITDKAASECQLGHHQEAADLYRSALAPQVHSLKVRFRPIDHDGLPTLAIKHNVAVCLFALRKDSEAAQLFREILPAASLAWEGLRNRDAFSPEVDISLNDTSWILERAFKGLHNCARQKYLDLEKVYKGLFASSRPKFLETRLFEVTGTLDTLADCTRNLSEVPNKLNWRVREISDVAHDLHVTMVMKVRAQIEYHFSGSQLKKDRYIRERMNKNGFVRLYTIAAYSQVRSLTGNVADLRDACKASDMLEYMQRNGVDRIKRNMPDWEDYVLPVAERLQQWPSLSTVREFTQSCEKGEWKFSDYEGWQKRHSAALGVRGSPERPKSSEDDRKARSTSPNPSTKTVDKQSQGDVNPPRSDFLLPSDASAIKRHRSVGGKAGTDKIAQLPDHAKLFDTETTKGTTTRSPADQWFGYLENETQPLFGNPRQTSHYRTKKADRRRIRIAILDTGIDGSNPAIKDHPRIQEKYCPISGQAADVDTSGHGTNLALLLLRIAPAADLYVARVFTSTVDISDEHIAPSIDKAVDEWDVDIITMSFGFRRLQEDMARAIKNAANREILMFAAASNVGFGDGIPRYPARGDRVFCIFSCDGYGESSKYNPTSRSRDFDFCALGEDVPISGQSSKRVSGTSVAAPIAAATAALILEFSRLPLIANQHEIERKQRLKEQRIAAMRQILEDMSDERQNRRVIRPWKILTVIGGDESAGVADLRSQAARKISEALQKL